MIYIIGVDHLVQYNGPVPESIRIEFRSYLTRLCSELYIAIIAEEFSEEALRDVYHATEETAMEAAKMIGVEHRYCDPGEKELAELGIPYFRDLIEQARRDCGAPASYIIDQEFRIQVRDRAAAMAKSYWHIREKYWYSRLRDVLHENILFICGHEHVDRFNSLLRECGQPGSIVDNFWKEEIFKDYANIDLA